MTEQRERAPRLNEAVQAEGWRCRRADWCRDAEPTRDPVIGNYLGRVGAMIDTFDGLCTACAGECRNAVRCLPADTAALGHLVQPSMAVKYRQIEIVDGGAGIHPGLPLATGPFALRELVDFTAAVWAEATADAIGLPWDTTLADATRQPVRIEQSCQLIDFRWEWFIALAATEQRHRTATANPLDGADLDVVTFNGADYWHSPDGVDGALLLLSLHERIVRLIGLDDTPPLRTPCPRCRRTALYREHAYGRVQCRGCWDVRMTDDEHDRYRATGQWPLRALPERQDEAS